MEKGRFAPLWRAGSGEQPLQLTVSELALFLEGSELVGRAPLSPEPDKLVPLFQPQTAEAVTS